MSFDRVHIYIGLIVILLFFAFTENVTAQKNLNDVVNIKTKKYKSSDYSIDKVEKSRGRGKNWANSYKNSFVLKSNKHKKYVRQLKGWECPSYKTFVYLKRKKLY